MRTRRRTGREKYRTINWNIEEHPSSDIPPEADINFSLKRYYGDDPCFRYLDGRIFFSGFSFTFLPGRDLEEGIDAEYLDWAKDNNLDLEVHKSDDDEKARLEVLPE